MSLIGRSFLALFLCSAFAARGALDIPPNLHYPQAPAFMEVYSLESSGDDMRRALADALDMPVPPVEEGGRGDVAVFRPYPAATPPGALSPTEAAREFFEGILPKDPPIVFVPSPPFRMVRQIVNRNETPGRPEDVSVFVRMDRFVGGLRVFGTGSLAVAEVRGSTVVGAVARWDKAVQFGVERSSRSLNRTRIWDTFASRFPAFAGSARVVPDSLELVYVGDRQFLEPAYRVLIQIWRVDAPDDFAVLYVPATTPLPRKAIVVETFNPNDCQNAVGSVIGVPFDLYSLEDKTFDWAGSARAFRKSLATNQSWAGRRFCLVRSRMLNGDKNLFVNSVPVTLVETHGLPGFLFTSNDNGVELATAGGYGIDAQGRLRLLVLHSCEVIQTKDDNEQWFDTWFAIFRGLHTVVGYRTKAMMDGVPAAFGLHLASGRPMIRSWIAEIAAFPEYGKGHLVDSSGKPKPIGRPAAVTVCSTTADAALSDLADISSPTCLVNYWLKD